ncbi:dual specificity protein phosphatase MPK-4-like isoform X1 [Zophobas morio]|uniref:dual specificity protein phosphatase MPK-4-like isoform X1 n=2 Tax=Zophobas morio TaxID=2755281 RepID=UPI003082CBC0
MIKSGLVTLCRKLEGLLRTDMNSVQKDDCSLSPISIDLIEPNLYLGGLCAAKDVNTLVKYKISHILTIDICPLPRKILELKNITTKYIQLSDQPKEDLLSHFDDTEAFITEGLTKGAVLVHCYFGVSRSATVVIAYIMKKYQLTYREAFEQVKLKRSIVYPNQGFISQLTLYKEMNYKLDPNNMKYKIFRLNIAADQVRKVKILPQTFMDLVKFDPGLTQTQPEPNVYRCKKCRRVLASESNLITHKINGDVCTKTYFLEPLAWMNVTQTTQEKLYCPKCSAKVGSFSWIMGCQCPCGVKVAPAFYLTPSKVDFTNVVKNVEMTF